MKLIFMGAPEFAVPSLKALIESKHDIVAVYTQPPRPAGRGHKLTKTPIHEFAQKHDIEVLTPKSLKDKEAQDEFKSWGADAAIVSAYGLLLPSEILQACKHGCINVHPSALPRWRGAAPIAWPIIAGDKNTAICIMQMNEGLDTGDILLRKDYEISSDMTAGKLHNKLSKDSADMIVEVLEQVENEQLNPQKQPEEGTYAKKLNKNTGHIDFSKSAEEIDCLIRGVTPWPSAYFLLNGEKFKVLEAICTGGESHKITGITLDDKLTIACADGTIQPTIIQRQGKKSMQTEALLRGFKIPEGTKLS